METCSILMVEDRENRKPLAKQENRNSIGVITRNSSNVERIQSFRKIVNPVHRLMSINKEGRYWLNCWQLVWLTIFFYFDQTYFLLTSYLTGNSVKICANLHKKTFIFQVLICLQKQSLRDKRNVSIKEHTFTNRLKPRKIR